MSTVGATAKYTLGMGVTGYAAFKGFVGDAGKKINRLGAEVKRLTDTSKRATRFRELGKLVRATKSDLTATTAEIKRLGDAIGKTDRPSRELQQNFTRAKSRAAGLSKKFKEQKNDLRGLKRELKEAGIDTKQLGRAQAELTRKTEAAQRAQRRLGDIMRQQDALRTKMGKHRGRMIGACSPRV